MKVNENAISIMQKIRGGRCAVLGYGISNRPLVPWLLAHGAASVGVRDKRTPEKMEEDGDLATLRGMGILPVCGPSYADDLTGYDVIFRSPGIRPDIPGIRSALEYGAVLTSEMELFLTLTEATVLAITGSDGKTTTTTLTSLFLKKQAEMDGRGKVYLGGNIGVPLLPMVDDMTAEDHAVVELSSFQLMTMDMSPTRAAITNITPNHLNWHTDMAEYVAAKAGICLSEGLQYATLNLGNMYTRAIGAAANAPVTWFSAYDEPWQRELPRRYARAGSDRRVFARDGVIYLADAAGETAMLEISRIRLPGRHNIENYMTAIGLTAGLVTPEAVGLVADEFTGVPHRLELVRERDGVRYYNGSIDSSPNRACAALHAMREMNERDGRADPIVICGGQDKHIPFDQLADGLCALAKAVVLTGEARDQILAALHRCPAYDSEKLPVTVIPDYVTAMREACLMATPGDTVLLSPACTSFDAFRNFEERGETFRRIVAELP